MNINDQFYKFYKPELNIVADAIKKGKAVTFVGINAIGKSILAEQIISERFNMEYHDSGKNHIILLDLKDKKNPSKEQIYRYWWTQTANRLKIPIENGEELNDFSFYSKISEAVKNTPRDEKVSFVILDFQNLLHLSDEFFQSLIYLHIYSYGKISYILLSEPHILSVKNPEAVKFLQKLTNFKFHFLKTFDVKTTQADILRQSHLFQFDYSRYRNMIAKHSKGLHGVIRTFCYLIKDNPELINIKRMMKVAENNKLCGYWVNEVLDSLPEESVRMLKESYQGKIIKNCNNIFYLWLIDLYLVNKKGMPRYPLMKTFIGGYAKNYGKTSRLYFKNKSFFINGEKVKLTAREFKVLHALYKSGNKTVSYDKLGECIWGSNPDEFSLWAIAQTVKRLRDKLSHYFINPQAIKSVRGEGYFFNYDC